MISVLRTSFPFFSYLTALVVLSVIPFNTKGELNEITVLNFRGDYVIHTLMFLPFLPLAYFWKYSGSATGFLVAWIPLALFSAILIEGLQYYIPYRAFNLKDALANGAGVLSGGIILLISKKLSK